MIATRKVVKSSMRALYRASRVRDVEHYGAMLAATLRELAPALTLAVGPNGDPLGAAN